MKKEKDKGLNPKEVLSSSKNRKKRNMLVVKRVRGQSPIIRTLLEIGYQFLIQDPVFRQLFRTTGYLLKENLL